MRETHGDKPRMCIIIVPNPGIQICLARRMIVLIAEDYTVELVEHGPTEGWGLPLCRHFPSAEFVPDRSSLSRLHPPRLEPGACYRDAYFLDEFREIDADRVSQQAQWQFACPMVFRVLFILL